MGKVFFVLGSLIGGIGVAIGAFGAHGLKNRIPPEILDSWEVAVRYQMYHALALIAVAWAITQWPAEVKLLSVGGWAFMGGILLFSGSLYILVLSGIKWLGAITPVGGVAFVVGWACLVIASLRG